MIEAAITGASVALLNAVREAMSGNWKPLGYTIASGVVALVVTWLAGSVSVEELRMAFVLGLGGSGVYTLVTKVGGDTVPSPEKL